LKYCTFKIYTPNAADPAARDGSITSEAALTTRKATGMFLSVDSVACFFTSKQNAPPTEAAAIFSSWVKIQWLLSDGYSRRQHHVKLLERASVKATNNPNF